MGCDLYSAGQQFLYRGFGGVRQAQILDLVKDLRRRVNTAVLLITHDIGVVREMCEDVVVMYGGRLMESGTVAQVTDDPSHPYTVGLLSSMPARQRRGRRLDAIGGMVCPTRCACRRAARSSRAVRA